MKAKQRLAVTQILFPEKNNNRYMRYNSKNKDTHLLLHRIGNDVGYPQDMLPKPKSLSKSKDFEAINKKKITDSSIDYTNASKISIVRSKYKLDPRKLLIYRKNEMHLKSHTRINMQK